jgi:hypothetical protein
MSGPVKYTIQLLFLVLHSRKEPLKQKEKLTCIDIVQIIPWKCLPKKLIKFSNKSYLSFFRKFICLCEGKIDSDEHLKNFFSI